MITASCGAVVRRLVTGPVGELVTPPPLPEYSTSVALLGSRAAQSGRELEAFSFRLVRPFAVALPLPEKQSINQLSGPRPEPLLLLPPTPGRKRFVRPAAEHGIDELVESNEQSFDICHIGVLHTG